MLPGSTAINCSRAVRSALGSFRCAANQARRNNARPLSCDRPKPWPAVRNASWAIESGNSPLQVRKPDHRIVRAFVQARVEPRYVLRRSGRTSMPHKPARTRPGHLRVQVAQPDPAPAESLRPRRPRNRAATVHGARPRDRASVPTWPDFIKQCANLIEPAFPQQQARQSPASLYGLWSGSAHDLTIGRLGVDKSGPATRKSTRPRERVAALPIREPGGTCA